MKISQIISPQLKKMLEKQISIVNTPPPPFAVFDENVTSKIEDFYQRTADKYDYFVHIGIGGSSLGAKALVRALGTKNSPRFFFLDNIDPETTTQVLDSIKPERTLFYLVSKTGSTLETIATWLIAMKKIKNLKKNVIVATGPDSGYLRGLATEKNLVSFEIPRPITGRFSTLTPVGLVPARFCGADIFKIMQGAKRAFETSQSVKYSENTPYTFAVSSYYFYKTKANILVLMSYADALETVVDLFCQLWAESLGKDGKGQTPLKARGATDQHSLIQLLNEGPRDKLIVFLHVEQFRRDLNVPIDSNEFSNLKGKSLSFILNCEKKGTEQALKRTGKPTMTLELKEINEESVGELVFMLQMATFFEGKLLGVDPFNQPGVEEGKKLTLKLLS